VEGGCPRDGSGGREGSGGVETCGDGCRWVVWGDMRDELPTMKFNSCRAAQSTNLSFMVRCSSCPRRSISEGSSIYAGKGVNLYVNDFDRVPRTSASALKSSMRCSARMFIIGNTTVMAPSAFSCSGSERKYGRIGHSRCGCLGS